MTQDRDAHSRGFPHCRHEDVRVRENDFYEVGALSVLAADLFGDRFFRPGVEWGED